jgi:gluconolactonase
MTQSRFDEQTCPDFSRRSLIKGIAAVAGVVTIGTRFAMAQSTQTAATPPSTVTNPPRDFGPGAPPLPIPIRTFSRSTPFSTDTG